MAQLARLARRLRTGFSPGLFWLNKVLCTIAAADWRASNRGINSAAVYAAKVLACREVAATMPAGLIKTKKAFPHILGVVFHGSYPRVPLVRSGNDCVWKFPQRMRGNWNTDN